MGRYARALLATRNVGTVREPPLRSKSGRGDGITAHHPTSPQSQFKTHPPPFANAKGGRGERSETQGVHTPFFEL